MNETKTYERNELMKTIFDESEVVFIRRVGNVTNLIRVWWLEMR
jgi:hypothetical protein